LGEISEQPPTGFQFAGKGFGPWEAPWSQWGSLVLARQDYGLLVCCTITGIFFGTKIAVPIIMYG
jgi:hypothetical protein